MPVKGTEKLKDLTYEILYQLYHNERKSIKDITTMFEVTRPTIIKHAKKLGIEIKQNDIRVNKLKDLTYEILYQLHWVEEISLVKIAKKYDVTLAGLLRRTTKVRLTTRDKATAVKLAISGDKHPMKRPEVVAKFLGENNHNFGKSPSTETREQISSKLLKYFEENVSHNLGRSRPDLKGKPRDPKIVEKTTKSHRENRDKFSGANNWNWKGGITKLNESIRKSYKYHEWRAACHVRDKTTCQYCGGTKIELHVDHIVPFSFILNKNNITTFEQAIACEELWDISNGRVLCIKCHKNTDTYAHKAKNYISLQNTTTSVVELTD